MICYKCKISSVADPPVAYWYEGKVEPICTMCHLNILECNEERKKRTGYKFALEHIRDELDTPSGHEMESLIIINEIIKKTLK